MEGAAKKWQDKTRAGYPVVVYVENANCKKYPIHGAMFYEGSDDVHAWTAEGRFTVDKKEHPFDLMPVCKTKLMYKTIIELAKDYSFTCCQGHIDVRMADGGSYGALLSNLGGPVSSGDADAMWLKIFTREVDE